MVSCNYKTINNAAILGHFLSAVTMIFLYSDKSTLVMPSTESYLEWYLDNKTTTCQFMNNEFMTTTDNDNVSLENTVNFNNLKFYYETTVNNFQSIENNVIWPVNGELQIYDGNHGQINDNGNLEIRLESYINNLGHKEYRSSRLVMKDELEKLKLEIGNSIEIEFDAKLPMAYASNGEKLYTTPVWPALWLMGTGIYNDFANQPWPYCGEIDIMEFALNKGNNIYTNAIHWDNYGHHYRSFIQNTESIDLTETFNKFKTIITRTDSLINIQNYFNGALTNDYDISDSQYNNFYKEVNNNNKVINNYKYYGIIINIALGGIYPETTVVPDNFSQAKMEIKSITIDKLNL